MQIIAHKNNLYNNKDFINKVQSDHKNLNGIMLDIIKTKDERLLVFSPVSTNKTTIDTIQNNNLEEISYLDILTLEDALKILETFEEKILLNILPLNEAVVIEDHQKTVKNNENYIELVNSVISKYKHLKLYICSISHNLLYHIIRKIENVKYGVILSVNDSTYIDVDFYIFSPEMLKEQVLKQQLDLKKEVMIQMHDCDDMTNVTCFLMNTIKNNDMIKDMQFITNHSQLFYLICRDN